MQCSRLHPSQIREGSKRFIYSIYHIVCLVLSLRFCTQLIHRIFFRHNWFIFFSLFHLKHALNIAGGG